MYYSMSHLMRSWELEGVWQMSLGQRFRPIAKRDAYCEGDNFDFDWCPFVLLGDGLDWIDCVTVLNGERLQFWIFERMKVGCNFGGTRTSENVPYNTRCMLGFNCEIFRLNLHKLIIARYNWNAGRSVMIILNSYLAG